MRVLICKHALIIRHIDHIFADYKLESIIDLKVKVKFDITNELLRSDFLLMFNTFHMSVLLK